MSSRVRHRQEPPGGAGAVPAAGTGGTQAAAGRLRHSAGQTPGAEPGPAEPPPWGPRGWPRSRRAGVLAEAALCFELKSPKPRAECPEDRAHGGDRAPRAGSPPGSHELPEGCVLATGACETAGRSAVRTPPGSLRLAPGGGGGASPADAVDTSCQRPPRHDRSGDTWLPTRVEEPRRRSGTRGRTHCGQPART